MKWSEIDCGSWVHLPYDENQRAIKGYFLTTLGVDLENIPLQFFETCAFYNNNNKNFSEYTEQIVRIKDIVGSSYEMYSNIPWLNTFQKLKRADYYIQKGCVTPRKYFRQLKLPVYEQWNPIKLTRSGTGYFIDGNGNHRITLYKMMYYSEVSNMDSRTDTSKIDNKYILRALVRTEC